MKNFQLIAQNVDVFPLLHAVTVGDLWNLDRSRTTFKGSAHTSADDILIRFSPIAKGDTPEEVCDCLDVVWKHAATELPQVRGLVFDLARRVEATSVGRVIITRLAPGKTIKPHRDTGAYALAHRRYHIALQGYPGSQFRCGDESVCMRSGEVWWFNAQDEHEVINNSQDDRIHLIVDLRI